MSVMLNDSATTRFTYYFDGKITRKDRAHGPATRHVLLFTMVAILSLSWVPVEHWVERRGEAVHARQRDLLVSDLRSRMVEADQVQQILASFRTGLSRKMERQVAVLICDQAREYHLDPFLVLALIKTESYFYNEAVSPVGAQGLMQVMPAVGEQLAKQLSLPYPNDRALFNPLLNIKLGTYFLSYLLDRFDGNLELALIAYNRGPNGVSKAMFAGEEIPNHYAERVLYHYDSLLHQRGQLEARNQTPMIQKVGSAISRLIES